MPPASPRDYIAAYTHPLPAGTFNRSYVCDSLARQATYYCEYDSPDLPAGGGRFLKQFSIAQGKVTVRETLAPRDKTSTAQLVSVSGFARADSDTVLRSKSGDAVGIFHRDRVATMRWAHEDVASVDVRQSRGAELVTLTFARATISVQLEVRRVESATEAQQLLDAF